MNTQSLTKLLLVGCMSAASHPVFAWKLGQPLSKLVEDTAKDVEKAVQNGGKALEDVVTLGEAGRRRDKERAESDRKMAQAIANHAVELKRQHDEQVKQSIVALEGDVVMLKQFIRHLEFLGEQVAISLTYVDKLATTVLAGEKEYETLVDIVYSQGLSLLSWLEKATTGMSEFELGLSTDVAKLVKNYISQVDLIPQKSDEENIEDIIESSLGVGVALSEYIVNHIDNLKALKVTKESEIKTLEQTLK